MPHLRPVFRRSISGHLVVTDSAAASLVKKEGRKRSYEPPNKVETVRNEAMEAVKQAGGDIKNKADLLGQFKVQFGAFRYNKM